MKKTLALLGVVACAVGVSSLQATPDIGAPNAVVTQPTKYPAAQPRRATIYITSVPAVGSHLPLVVRRYRGAVDCMSPTAVYSAPQLDQSGQLNVAGEIIQRDPAFAGGFRH